GVLDRGGVVVGQVVGVGQEGGGGVGFAAVVVAGGGGPLEGTRSGLGEVEVAVGFDLVVASAQGCEVGDVGGSASGGVGVVPLLGVVELAFDGAVGAAGSGAGAVAGQDVVDHGLGGSVAGVAHVEDGAGEGVGDDAVPVAAGG